MALELLAGPFAVRNPDATAVDLYEAATYPTALYDDVVGLGSSMPAAGSTVSFSVTQLDGVTYARAPSPNAQHYILDLQSDQDWLMIELPSMASIYAFDRKTGTRGTLILTGGAAEFSDAQARAADRWLSFVNANVKSRPLDISTDFAAESTLVGAGSGRANLSRTRHSNILCLIWPSGEVLYYDFVARAQAPGAAFVGANTGAWYSPLHDIFVVLTGTSTNYVSVYANSVLPTAISDPTASPALTRGRVSQISVTLTGANGDASAGELVDWTLTGPGALLTTQSESDANGVASVGYIAPLNLSTDPTFTATVTL